MFKTSLIKGVVHGSSEIKYSFLKKNCAYTTINADH